MTKKILHVMLVLVFFALTLGVKSANAAPALPPENFFKFPFPSGRWWRITGGPHSIGGKDDNASEPYSGLDFKPTWHSGCGTINNNKDFVVAAATGKVVEVGSYHLIIDHGNNWSSVYYHLDKMIKFKKGDTVNKNQPIGNPSCKGNATGAHVHFAIKYKGKYVSIAGAVIEGWKVNSAKSEYEGCLTHTLTGNKICSKNDVVPDTSTTAFHSMMTTVELRSVFNGKSIAVDGGSKENFASVVQQSWNDQPHQKWYLIPLDGKDLGYYILKSVQSGKCIDINNATTESGRVVIQYDCSDQTGIADNRKFTFVPAPSGFHIKAKHSGMGLGVTSDKTDKFIWQGMISEDTRSYWKVILR